MNIELQLSIDSPEFEQAVTVDKSSLSNLYLLELRRKASDTEVYWVPAAVFLTEQSASEHGSNNYGHITWRISPIPSYGMLGEFVTKVRSKADSVFVAAGERN